MEGKKMNMSKLLRAVNIIVFIILISGCNPLTNLFKAEEDLDELSMDIGDATTFKTNWRNGTISVTSDSTTSEITVTGKKYTWANTTASAEAALDDITISLELDDTDTTVAVLKFEAPEDFLVGITYGSDVEIVLPTSIKIDINSVNGAITVKQTEGDTNIMLTNGAITIDSTGGNVDVMNTNGAITIKARPNLNGTVEGETVTGAVSIQVPKDFGATVDLQVEVGAVVAAFDEFDSVDIQLETLFKATAILNGGGGEIIGETTIGIVTLDALE